MLIFPCLIMASSSPASSSNVQHFFECLGAWVLGACTEQFFLKADRRMWHMAASAEGMGQVGRL